MSKTKDDPIDDKDLFNPGSSGAIFTLVAYRQLIVESRDVFEVEEDVFGEIFDFMVSDFSKYVLQLLCKPNSSAKQND